MITLTIILNNYSKKNFRKSVKYIDMMKREKNCVCFFDDLVQPLIINFITIGNIMTLYNFIKRDFCLNLCVVRSITLLTANMYSSSTLFQFLNFLFYWLSQNKSPNYIFQNDLPIKYHESLKQLLLYLINKISKDRISLFISRWRAG